MRSLCIALAATLFLSGAAQADTLTIGDLTIDFDDVSKHPRGEAQEQLVKAYLSALSSKSLDQLRGMVHPASLACAKSDIAKQYLDEVLANDLKRDVPANAKIVFVPYVGRDPTTVLLPPDVGRLPVALSFVLGVSYDRKDREDAAGKQIMTGVTHVKLVALSGDDPSFVIHCLTEKGERIFAEKNSKARSNGRGTKEN